MHFAEKTVDKYWLLRRYMPGYRRIPYLFSSVSPRRDDIWLFGSETGSGAGFSDNGKYLYLYCHHNTNVTPIWISQNQELVKDLNNLGYHAYTPQDSKAIYYTLRSSVAVITRSLLCSDIPWEYLNGAKQIQLWHGTPLKKITFDVFNTGLPRNRKTYINNWDAFITTSDDLAADLFVDAGVPREILEVAGYPRNDALHRTIPGENILFDEYDRYTSLNNSYSPLITYLPTWREYDSNPVEDALDINALDDVLASIDTHLLIKSHAKTGTSNTGELKNISFLQDNVDIYPILRQSDALITDYSSVYFDYILTDNNIIFYPYDLKKYKHERGFHRDFEFITPGPQATNFDELCSQIINFAAGTDRYSQEREELRSQVHTWTDGEYSRRVYEAIQCL